MWLIVGVLIHWIVIRVEKRGDSQVCQLVVIDSMNYPLDEILGESFEGLVKTIEPKNEARFIQFLKDYKHVL